MAGAVRPFLGELLRWLWRYGLEEGGALVGGMWRDPAPGGVSRFDRMCGTWRVGMVCPRLGVIWRRGGEVTAVVRALLLRNGAGFLASLPGCDHCQIFMDGYG